jgi:hypothetical protein
MNRREVVLLLKEIMVVCESFHDAQAVSIQNEKGSDSWELHVWWVPYASETPLLQKIVANHGLEMVTYNGKSIFRSKKIS